MYGQTDKDTELFCIISTCKRVTKSHINNEQIKLYTN